MELNGIDITPLMKYFWVPACGAVIVIVYLIGKLAMRKRLAKLRELAPRLEGRAVSGFLDPRFEGVKGGRNFTVSIVSGSKKTPPAIRLTIDCFLPADFSIQRPGAMARFWNLFLKPVPTGDSDFDDNFFSYSTAPDSFAVFFADSRRRDSARRLLERGYIIVESRKGKASADIPAPDLQAGLEPGKIGGALDDLASLSA